MFELEELASLTGLCCENCAVKYLDGELSDVRQIYHPPIPPSLISLLLLTDKMTVLVGIGPPYDYARTASAPSKPRSNLEQRC